MKEGSHRALLFAWVIAMIGRVEREQPNPNSAPFAS